MYGIAIMADDLVFPDKFTFYISTYNNDTGLIPLDSICGFRQELYYSKQLIYDFDTNIFFCNDTINHSNFIPCNFYLFDQRVSIPETFYMGSIWYGENNHFFDGYRAYVWTTSPHSCLSWVLELETGRLLHTPDICDIFPVFQLPCVTPRKPQTETHRAGHARISWHPGDTALYQLVFRSPNGTVVLETDTLADTSFVLTDSLIADTSLLREGWCSVSLRKACNYMDSPYHTIVWSDWSEPKRFYYTPYRDINGISTPVVEPPYFTLAPNPAAGDVTVTFGDPLPEGCTLDLFGPDGRLLSSQPLPAAITTFQFTAGQLPTGLYLLRLSTPVTSTSRKLSIVR